MASIQKNNSARPGCIKSLFLAVVLSAAFLAFPSFAAENTEPEPAEEKVDTYEKLKAARTQHTHNTQTT